LTSNFCLSGRFAPSARRCSAQCPPGRAATVHRADPQRVAARAPLRPGRSRVPAAAKSSSSRQRHWLGAVWRLAAACGGLIRGLQSRRDPCTTSSRSPSMMVKQFVQRQVDAVVSQAALRESCRCGCGRCGRRCRPGSCARRRPWRRARCGLFRGCARSAPSAPWALLLCWLRPSWHSATMPVGMWVMRTAESVLLMC
jgi:hypothetical protein